MLRNLRAWPARVLAIFRPRALDLDLRDELESHVTLLSDEYQRRGMPAEEATRLARIEVGSITGLREAHRDVRGLPWLETIGRDIRHATRTLRRDPGFSLFACIIVGLGIGAAATVFGVVNTVLLRPLPFERPDRLVWIGNRADNGIDEWRVQVAHLLDLREQAASFAALGGYFAHYRAGDSKLTGAGEPLRATTVPVTRNFFEVLGVSPGLGRTFSEEEAQLNGPRAVLLSHGFWVRQFAAAPDVVGRVLTLNDVPATVIGVMPASFDFGAVFDPGRTVDLFSVFPLTPETSRWGNTLAVVGRLADDATLARASAELEVLGRHLTEQHRGARNTLRPISADLATRVNGRVRPALLVLALAVGVVMLIVCANVSNLQLARVAARQREMAVRVSLGATRWQLVRQSLVESIVLASAGAVLGLALALTGTRMVSRLEAFDIPLLGSVGLDGTVVSTLVAMAFTTGVMFGLLPALHLPVDDVQEVLRDSTRGTSRGRGSSRIRRGLVVAEVAFACVLLVGTGLLVRSFLRVIDVDLGYRPTQVAALRVDWTETQAESEEAWMRARLAYFDEVLRLTRDIHGVGGVALADVLPLGGDRSRAVHAVGQQFPDGQYPEGFFRVTSDGYLGAMGVPLVAGRDFTPDDSVGSDPVVLVNETLARTLWPGEDAVGKSMHAHGVDNPQGVRRVVGVVGDVRHRALEQAAGAELYVPIRQTTDHAAVHLVVRATMPTSALAGEVRRALSTLAPDLPVNEWQELQGLVERSVSPRRFVVVVLAAFSMFALVLAALGIYAVVSYGVGQRTREIGIRMALGATPRDVQRGVTAQTLVLATTGVAIGATVSIMLSRFLRSLLYGVQPVDPTTFGLVAGLLLAVTLLAGFVPARRAARVDPMSALRHD